MHSNSLVVRHGEEAKKPSVGAGLCPNYTISRAILSDAGKPLVDNETLTVCVMILTFLLSHITVALVRGDRFYTVSGAEPWLGRLLGRKGANQFVDFFRIMPQPTP